LHNDGGNVLGGYLLMFLIRQLNGKIAR